jgi:CRP-like cAMP-binding protein
MTELEKHIQAYFPVSDEELAAISTLFKTTSIRKGGFYLKTGKLSEKLAFIQSGIVREFVIIDGSEITKWISTKGYFLVDLASFLFSLPARWNLQALTDCELYVIDRADYKKLNEIAPNWPQLEKLFLARCFQMLEERVLQHLSLSAEDRYKLFFASNSELFNQVPLQYLASMLGMTPETFSRIRNKTAEKNP